MISGTNCPNEDEKEHGRQSEVSHNCICPNSNSMRFLYRLLRSQKTFYISDNLAIISFANEIGTLT